MSWVTAYTIYVGEYNLARLAAAGVVLFSIPICVVVGREVWYRKRAHQLFKEGKGLYVPTVGEIDEQSIRSKEENGEARLNWSAFCGYRIADTVAVLYLNFPASYVIIARSKFNNEQDWTGFRQLVGRKLQQI